MCGRWLITEKIIISSCYLHSSDTLGSSPSGSAVTPLLFPPAKAGVSQSHCSFSSATSALWRIAVGHSDVSYMHEGTIFQLRFTFTWGKKKISRQQPEFAGPLHPPIFCELCAHLFSVCTVSPPPRHSECEVFPRLWADADGDSAAGGTNKFTCRLPLLGILIAT